jgi:hypothetical protein
MCVQTPRAFYAEGGARAPSTDGLEGALSASAEQSEPRTPFDWSDKARTMQEEPARWLWAEDKDTEQEATIAVGEERALRLSPREEEGEYYYCSREATPLPPPSPIGDYAVVDPSPEEAPETQAPVNEKKVSVYFSGQRCGAARRRAAKKAPKPQRVGLPMGEDATLARGALVYGMAGAMAEERRRLIEVARELRGGAKGWAGAIEETINGTSSRRTRRCFAWAAAPTTTSTSGARARGWRGTRRWSWTHWTACARRRMRRRRRSTGCWCNPKP